MSFATVNKDTATLGVKVGQVEGSRIVSHILDLARCNRNSDWSIVDSDNVDGSPRLLKEIKLRFHLEITEGDRISRFSERLSLDSLNRVELVMDFEQEFSIEIPDEQADKLKCCADVANYIMSAPKQEAASEDS
ncbi:Acyl carrier protein (ACP) [Artemisia annua]|uniref:Acyl carrier protein n=1 Tax=Artemisia annua TaxID=35608 RepID=A0A2U1QFU5_ARTAN|nr:Acyl carrier protein (ACP) [Artemisia annua]